MENPVSTITSAAKSAFTIRNIVLGIVTAIVVFGIAELTGMTNLILSPVSFFKGKLGKSA
ncbi:MAG: hypothetical protein U1F65_05775 [Verrucomicrobiota bacterium]